MRPSNDLENKTPSDTYWRVQLVYMYESSGWQFFRATFGIQSEPDVFDEWRLIMNFLTI